MRWVGYVAPTGMRSVTNRALVGKPEEKRTLGRSRNK
jgi:hypothetical protein